jgi:hypothetical protein
VTSNFVQRTGSKIYFNPLIPLKTFKNEENPDLYANDARRLKYGIIQKDDAIEDLTDWHAFALAGRMQKPILPIFEDPDIVSA